MNPTLHNILRTALPILALSVSFNASAHGTGPGFLGIDDNNNGLSDVYEAIHPGLTDRHADNDKDGITNEDEAAAGTNPLNNTDSLSFQSVTNSGLEVQAQFSSVTGKLYQLQSSPALDGNWTDEGLPVQGNGANIISTFPAQTTRTFLRIKVSDQDTDADGVTDWEEIQAGTNRYLWDSDGDGRSDGENVRARLASANLVNVVTTKPFGSEEGSLPVEFQITRHGGISPVIVSYSLSGTASPGTDYPGTASGTVTFAPGQRTALVALVPFSDATPESPETVILTINAGAGYSIGTAGSASGSMEDSHLGLRGRYYNSQETTYPTPPATNLNFNPANLNTTRIDPVIDFNFGAGAPAGTTITSVDSYGARWTGFLTPPTTGNYLFHVQMDRGAVLYINGVAVINQWSPTQDILVAAPEFATANIALVAGTRVPIQLDFRESGTTNTRAEVHLRWTPPGGTKEIVPSSVLWPEGNAPVITSSPTAFSILGAPFTHNVVAAGATAFTASNLPTGLTIDPVTGVISGTPSGAAGLKFATIMASNSAGSTTQEITLLLVATGGTIEREVWTGLTGTGVLSVPTHTAPTAVTSLSSLESPENDGDNYGERLRGFITAPSTGLFTFFVSSDENAEVWISSSEEPANTLKRSFVTNATISPGSWNVVTSQQSLPVQMSGGSRYFIEVIRREQTGTDHLQVGWLKPGQTGTPEVIPGWALSPYAPPVATNNEGYLYAATLTPQSGASTLGTGSALLRVNEDKTEAYLTVTWGNLTGSVTNSHIHDSRDVPGPTGAIIFDVDDADPDRLLPGGDGLDPTEVYEWVFPPGGTGQHTYADIIEAIEGGYAYLNLHTAAYPNGEIKGLFQPVIGSQIFTPPADPPAAELTLPANATARKRAIVRFLQQATFGAAPDRDGATDPAPANVPFNGWQPDSIEAVDSLGYTAWIDAQLAMDRGPDPEIVISQTLPPNTVYGTAPSNGRRTPNTNMTGDNGSGPMATLVRQYYEKYPRSSLEPNGSLTESSSEIWRAWWKLACTAPDQVRHRVAFALSQILVASEEGEFDERARWVSHYYDILYYHGLDNYRTLLEKVTLNPLMGGYLDMLNNQKANPSTGYIPNENYAREIMQLFSIGLRRLHPDGTLVLNSSGLPVPTYLQDNVVGLAATLTGWQLPSNPGNWIKSMVVSSASRHDFTKKLLLEEAYIPASATQTVAQCNLELDQSHDLLFHHPNTGPFICRQLIQRMVTANPSPGYIYRVARVFADNGSGVRGDMKAVVKALLLDPEARNTSYRSQPGFGHQKEPVVKATQVIRAFKGYSLAESKPEWANANDLGLAITSPAVNVDLTQPLPQRQAYWPDSTNRTLTTAIADTPATGSVTITLSSAPSTFITVGMYLRINAEDFLVTAVNTASNFTADRAQRGTAAAAHATGVTVNRLTLYNDNYIDEMLDPDGAGGPLPLTLFSMVVQPGNLILLRRQTAGSLGTTTNGETISPENGFYVVAADPATSNPVRYKLVRNANADTGPELTKAFVLVSTARRDDGTLSGNRVYYQQLTVATVDVSPQYWVNQSQTSTSRGTANFSPATNINIAGGFASTTGTTRTATITENIGGTNYDFNVSTGQLVLLRRQTANAGYIDSDGNTSSPENGLYTVTNDPGNSARVILVRNTNNNSASEMLNASVVSTQTRMDDGSLYPSVASSTAEAPSLTFRQELTVTTIGTDPVRWALQTNNSTANLAGANLRQAWGMGTTGSSSLSQTPLKSPTVFNFFEPDYIFSGNTGDAGLYAPEFQITSETSVVNAANWYYDLTRRNSTNTATQGSPFSYGQGFAYGDPYKKDVKLDLTTERDTLATNTGSLLDHLETMLMPDQMTPQLRVLLLDFLNTQTTAATDADKMNRLGEALWLLSLTPEFTTQQ